MCSKYSLNRFVSSTIKLVNVNLNYETEDTGNKSTSFNSIREKYENKSIRNPYWSPLKKNILNSNFINAYSEPKNSRDSKRLGRNTQTIGGAVWSLINNDSI